MFAAERAAAEAWAKRFGEKRRRDERNAEPREEAHERIDTQESKKQRHMAETENCKPQTSSSKPLEQMQKPASPTPKISESNGASKSVIADLVYDDVAEETE